MTTTAPAKLAAGRWVVDAAHSTAAFRVRDLGGTAAGTVPVIEGTVDIGSDGLPSAISGSLDLGAIDTGNARRDKDLRKPRLLDLDRHPTMTFTAGTATVAPGGWSVTGSLTARGASISLAGDVQVSEQDGAVFLTARTRLDRRALGIRAPRIMIGREVGVTVTAVIRRSPAGAAGDALR